MSGTALRFYVLTVSSSRTGEVYDQAVFPEKREEQLRLRARGHIRDVGFTAQKESDLEDVRSWDGSDQLQVVMDESMLSVRTFSLAPASMGRPKKRGSR